MMASLVTLATTDAAATLAATWSPFHIASAGTASPRTGKPSVSTYPGRAASRASARRMPATLHTCSPIRSISAAGMITTLQASAAAVICW